MPAVARAAGKLQNRLAKHGYIVRTSPNKRSLNAYGGQQQGATDVMVVTTIYEIAGAFEPEPIADTVILIGGAGGHVWGTCCIGGAGARGVGRGP